MRNVLFSLFLALTSACTVASGFDGPGIDDPDVMVEGPVLAAITHTRVARGERQLFNQHLDAIKDQQDTHEGFLGRSLRTDLPGPERWTLTLWEDEEAMMRFVTEGAHLDAISNGYSSIEGLRSAVWTVSEDEPFPPTWEEALGHLEEQSPDVPWK